jgi:glycosyltransferase involved in cell wall biosynthesis
MSDQKNQLVTVVIPSYNHGRFIGRTLQSVLDQTYTNWEAIVIDNHSTDNTDEVLASFSSRKFTCLKINNKGVIALSRNAGIRAARGEWIAFLDSDDWWANNKLQTCINCINEKVDLIYHDMEITVDQKHQFKRKIIKSWQVKTPVLIDLLTKGNAIVNSSVIVRKNLLDKIGYVNESEEMVGSEDYNTWLRIAQLTNQFLYLPQKLGNYLIHNHSISKKNMSLPVRHAVNEFLQFLNEQQRIKIEASFRYTSGRFNFLTGNTSIAKDDLFFSLKYSSVRLKLKIIWMIIALKLMR